MKKAEQRGGIWVFGREKLGVKSDEQNENKTNCPTLHSLNPFIFPLLKTNCGQENVEEKRFVFFCILTTSKVEVAILWFVSFWKSTQHFLGTGKIVVSKGRY